MVRHIREGDLIPKWYGVAYQEPHLHGAVIAPIPLNIVLGLLKRIEYFLRQNPFSYKQKLCMKCFEAGFTRGRAMNQFDSLDAYIKFSQEPK